MASLVEVLARAGCVYAEDEAAILHGAAGTDEELAAMVARRTAGAPLEHVVGWTDFRGLRLVVDDGVFVPRPRTGFLVDEAAAVLRQRVDAPGDLVVVDLCCGVGAIGAALAAEVSGVRLHAVDFDPAAVACAARNLAASGGRALLGDLYGGLPSDLRGRVALVAASPPYVPTAEIRLLPTEARMFEPPVALDGGPDGVDVVRRIGAGGSDWLVPGGWLVVEVGESQVEEVVALVAALGYRARGLVSEEYGSAVVVAQLR